MFPTWRGEVTRCCGSMVLFPLSSARPRFLAEGKRIRGGPAGLKLDDVFVKLCTNPECFETKALAQERTQMDHFLKVGEAGAFRERLLNGW